MSINLAEKPKSLRKGKNVPQEKPALSPRLSADLSPQAVRPESITADMAAHMAF